MSELTFGERRVKELLDKAKKEGRESFTADELIEITTLSSEIDRLYNAIIESQRLMGVPKIWAGEVGNTVSRGSGEVTGRAEVVGIDPVTKTITLKAIE